MSLGMPGAMDRLAQHLESCPIALIALITDEVAKRGSNKAVVPFSLFRDGCPSGEHGDKCWIVAVEVNMPEATFDIEAHDPDLYRSVEKAVRATRRQLTDSRKTPVPMEF